MLSVFLTALFGCILFILSILAHIKDVHSFLALAGCEYFSVRLFITLSATAFDVHAFTCSFPLRNQGPPAGGKALQHNSVGEAEKRRKSGPEGVGRGGRGPLEVMVSRCVVIMAENLISAVAICNVYPHTATGINEAWEEVTITVVYFFVCFLCFFAFSFLSFLKNCSDVCVHHR